MRTVLCSGREDLERFDAAFEAVFGAGELVDPLSELGAIEREALPRAGIQVADGVAPVVDEVDAVPAAWSEVELLRCKDFSAYTDAETVAARALIARLARRGPTRVSRRLRPARRRGHEPDLRRTVRASLRTGGEPVERHWRAPSQRPRPFVLVCDVSGSMAPYARMLLQYLQACVAARRRVEAFAFGTRLTRVTHELSGRDQDLALARATAAVVDFSGGTRIGAAIASLNREHGRRVGRGAIVVILSDGWDRGDPGCSTRSWRGCGEARTGSCGSIRSRRTPTLSRSPVACALPSRTPTSCLAGNSLASLEQLADILEDA